MLQLYTAGAIMRGKVSTSFGALRYVNRVHLDISPPPYELNEQAPVRAFAKLRGGPLTGTTVLEIYRTVQGLVRGDECFVGGAACYSQSSCHYFG
ncbi:uncharacterized protein BCR38DRAFT_432521 [Pseudomassariella vexata]|uniref:Uncharacterized protein n=1 Tax=Pseudomassariella vexata TaxID=1141098 RepID=A0A1Y2E1D9_9PEZI|nr:uncharacterized protein BCR38DRAFT_432521 [Pseudomassariella vexata]ORY65350.1 hypothetical protein BCR38DRAFT_432521 [Pseudomassariella vexata]